MDFFSVKLASQGKYMLEQRSNRCFYAINIRNLLIHYISFSLCPKR